MNEGPAPGFDTDQGSFGVKPRHRGEPSLIPTAPPLEENRASQIAELKQFGFDEADVIAALDKAGPAGALEWLLSEDFKQYKLEQCDPDEDVWVCGACSGVNYAHDTHCSMCLEPKPHNESWFCDVCAHNNTPSRHVCELCLSPKDIFASEGADSTPGVAKPSIAADLSTVAEARRSPSPRTEPEIEVDEAWPCGVCTYLNLPGSTACQMCATIRGMQPGQTVVQDEKFDPGAQPPPPPGAPSRQAPGEQPRRHKMSFANLDEVVGADEMPGLESLEPQESMSMDQVRARSGPSAEIICEAQKVFQWSNDEVIVWIHSVNNGQISDYAHSFGKLSGRKLLRLGKAQIKKLINKVGPRKVFTKALEKLKKEAILKRGWLEKRGGVRGQKGFKRRFFLLSGDGRLYYYQDSKSADPKGYAELTTLLKFYKVKDKNNDTFHIETRNRMWVFKAPNEKERQEWIQSIGYLVETFTQELAPKGDAEGSSSYTVTVRNKPFGFAFTKEGLVYHVVHNSPAEQSGLRSCSLITHIGDKKVGSNWLERFNRTPVPFTLTSITAPTYSVTVTSKPFGMECKVGQKVLNKIHKSGLAHQHGCKPGDVIMSINGEEVTDANWFDHYNRMKPPFIITFLTSQEQSAVSPDWAEQQAVAQVQNGHPQKQPNKFGRLDVPGKPVVDLKDLRRLPKVAVGEIYEGAFYHPAFKKIVSKSKRKEIPITIHIHSQKSPIELIGSWNTLGQSESITIQLEAEGAVRMFNNQGKEQTVLQGKIYADSTIKGVVKQNKKLGGHFALKFKQVGIGNIDRKHASASSIARGFHSPSHSSKASVLLGQIKRRPENSEPMFWQALHSTQQSEVMAFILQLKENYGGYSKELMKNVRSQFGFETSQVNQLISWLRAKDKRASAARTGAAPVPQLFQKHAPVDPKESGYLRVKVVSGIQLKKSASYVKITLGRHALETKYVGNNEHPIWQDTLTFKGYRPGSSKKLTAEVAVYARSMVMRDTCIGKCVYTLPKKFNEVKKGVHEIKDKSKNVVGLIVLQSIVIRQSNSMKRPSFNSPAGRRNRKLRKDGRRW